MKNNENPKLCQDCGGQCCKFLPGMYHPTDVELNVDKIAEKFATGEWSIDYWEGNIGQLYFLRPSTKNSRGIVDPSWGGECIYLTETGCKLPFNRRPSGCQSLIPSKPDCIVDEKYNKYNSGLAWRPYKDILFEAVKKAENLTVKIKS